VQTEIGPIRIDELVAIPHPPRVLSYNHQTDSCEYKDIVAVRRSLSDELIEIHTARQRLWCTARHRIYTRANGYVEAGDCATGQGLLILHDGLPQADCINAIQRSYGLKLPVYDIQVDGNHNFFGNEILIHNCIVIDDPHKTREEPQSKEVESQVAAYGDTFATRHDNKKEGVTVIVMQRINDNDLSAHVMKTAEEEYVHLKIEAEATSHTTITFPRTGRIFTRNVGDLLWESREGPVEIRRQKAVMGPVEVCRAVPAGPDPGRRFDLSARVVQPSLPPRSRHWPAVGREAAYGHPELGHRGQEKGVQRLLGLHHLGPGGWRGLAHPHARSHDGPDGICRGAAEG